MEQHMEQRDIARAIEGILFASGESVPIERLMMILEIDESTLQAAVAELEAQYNDEKRGIRLLQVEESLQLCSAPEYAELIRRTLEKRRPPQLSQTVLEVLAIIAYFQPVTRAYIERVRGVDASYTVGLLVNRGLIEFCGNLPVPGRPALFRTTQAFLRTFGLTDLDELPPLPDAEDDAAQAQIREAIAAIQQREEEQVTVHSEQITAEDALVVTADSELVLDDSEPLTPDSGQEV